MIVDAMTQRRNERGEHDKASWTFNQKQYDIARSHFDATYRASIERASKRATKSNDTPRATRKRNAKTNDAPNVETTNENA